MAAEMVDHESPVGAPTPPVDVDLGDLDVAALGAVLRRRGWAVVKLDAALADAAAAAVLATQAFLDSTEGVSDMERWRLGRRYGYVPRTAHREAFRMLTGAMCEAAVARGDVPPALSAPVSALADALDATCRRILDASGREVFGLGEAAEEAAADDGGIPLHAASSRFGMLDFVRYDLREDWAAEEGSTVPPGTVCVAHSDPGLFALSFFAGTPGLQLYDPTVGPQSDPKAWFEAPVHSLRVGDDGRAAIDPGVAVLWTGSASVERTAGRGADAVQPGVHRVVRRRDAAAARFTAWYEVCTANQVPKEIHERGLVRGIEDGAGVSESPKAMTIYAKTLSGKTLSLQHTDQDTCMDFFCQLQDKEGLPPEKTRAIFKGKIIPHDDTKLVDFGLEHESTTHLVLRLRGPPSPDPEGASDASGGVAPMPISVMMLTGKKLVLDMTTESTAMDLFIALQNKEGLPPEKTRAIAFGKQIEHDERKLVEYGIKEGSTVHLVLQLRGSS